LNAASFRDGHADADASARVRSLNGSLEVAGRDERTGLSLRARRSESAFRAFPDSSGGPDLAVIRDTGSRETTDSTIGGSWRALIAGRHELTVNASTLDHDERIDSPGVAPGPGGAIPANRSRTEFQRRMVTAYVSSVYRNAIEAAFGLSLEQQSGASNGYLTIAPGTELPTSYELDRDNAAAFLELGWPVTEAVRLEAALRVDDSNVAARATTHRVNLSYQPGLGPTRIRFTAAEAYKLPSLFALGDPLTGNPALRPETAESLEIGVDFGDASSRGSVGFAVFSQRFSDLIDFDFDTFRNVNRDRVRTDGIEWHGRWRIDSRLTLTGNLTALDIDVVDSDDSLRQRPERYGSVGARWTPAPALSVYASMRYVGPRLDEAIPVGEQTLPSYTRMDLAVRWQVSRLLTLGFAVDDVGDERYEDAIGFPSLGRRYRLSLHAVLPAS
jgi:outer membrane receptor protein involved in Fe transport